MMLSIDDLLRVRYTAVRNFENVGSKPLAGVSTDSRSVHLGEVFVALRGVTSDGHTFVAQAIERGAVCAIVDEHFDAVQQLPLFVVPDTIRALGELAHVYRKKFTIPFVAVAGSNGKTTTKEMITAILNTQYSTLSTQGNLNNHIGVPQTLFRVSPEHEIAIVEIGTNHPGEIARLCEILDPTHGVITNVGREHLEYFGDLSGVAEGEGELFAALGRSGGLGFVNADDPYLVEQATKLRNKTTFGFSRDADVRGELVAIDDHGCVKFKVRSAAKRACEVQLSMPGKHAVSNALASAAVGLAFDVSAENIERSLGKFQGFSKRMEILHAGGVTIVNDTYNANPDSVTMALETVQAMKCGGKKIIILADMLELGAASRREHEQIGELIGRIGFEYLLTFGEMAAFISEHTKAKVNVHYDQKNVLSEYAAELVSDGDCVLVKGSRGMHMEDVVTFLVERLKVKDVLETNNQ